MVYNWLIAVFVVVTAVVAYLLVDRIGDKNTVTLLMPNSREVVALGQQIYAENCASCHGANLEGQPNWRSPGPEGRLPAPPHDESGHTWHHTDDVLFGLTKYGVAEYSGLENFESDMPIYKDTLSDEEIIAVLSFIKARWPQDIRDRHDQMNRQDAE